MNPYEDIPVASNLKVVDSSDKRINTEMTSAEEVLQESKPKRKREERAPAAGTVNNADTTLEKLEAYLITDKKFDRAASLFVEYCNSTALNESTAAKFFAVVDRLMQIDRDVLDNKFSRQYESIIDCIWDKSEVFRNEDKYTIKSWYLAGSIRIKLQTDDSFEFAKHMRFLTDCIKEIEVSNDEQIATVCNNQRQHRLEIILSCLETAYKKYTTWLWAKQPLENAFSKATEKRPFLPASICSKLDVLTNILEMERRKSTSWAGPQTVRVFNSISHPLQKKTGLLR